MTFPRLGPVKESPVAALGALLELDFSGYNSFSQLLSNESEWRAEVDKSFLLVSHLGELAERRSRPDTMEFTYLGCFGPKETFFDSPKPNVIGLTYTSSAKGELTWHAYFVEKLAAKAAVRRTARPLYEPSKDVHALLKPSNLGSLVKLAENEGADDELDETNHEPPPPPENEPSPAAKDLPELNAHLCTVCQNAEVQYRLTVDSKGPQQRYSCPPDGKEYLFLLGLDSEENKKLLDYVLRLSITAFDCESMTTWTEECGEGKVEAIAEVRHPTGSYAYQSPTMIGYGDSFGEGEEAEVKIFTCRGEEPAGPGEMIKEFVEHLIVRGKALSAKKMLLLRPVFDFLADVEKHHLDFFRQKGLVDEQARSAFAQTIFGRAKRHFLRLAATTRVFSLHGSSYDNPLILSRLACLLKDKGVRLTPIKNGSKVSKLTFKIGEGFFSFHDITSLCAPSTSLAGFAKLVGLEQKKLVFPHHLYTSSEFLERRSLPDDVSEWFDPLTQTTASPEDIETAKKDFLASGSKNVGEYLKYYLKCE